MQWDMIVGVLGALCALCGCGCSQGWGSDLTVGLAFSYKIHHQWGALGLGEACLQ